MQLLPKWVLPPTMPSIYDLESYTALEMTAKVYGAMNTLIAEYNKFADSVNAALGTFTDEETAARTNFETEVTKVYRQFMCQMEQYLQINLDTTAKNIIWGSIEDGTIPMPTDIKLEKKGIAADAAATGKKIADTALSLANEIAVERARISTLTANSESGTAENAELVDIRVAYNGLPYNTAGEAVRAQAKIWDVAYPALPVTWIEGIYVRPLTGETLENVDLSASEYIDISDLAGMSLEIKGRFTTAVGCAFYDNGKEYISGSTSYSGTEPYTIPIPTGAHYFRFSSFSGAEYERKCYVKPVMPVSDVFKYAKSIMNYKEIPFGWVDGVYIRGKYGDTIENADFATSEFIDISAYAGMTIDVKSRLFLTQGFSFYDKTQTFISGLCGNDIESDTQENISFKIVAPSDAGYIRICTTDNKKDSCYVKPIPTMAEVIERVNGGSSGASTMGSRAFSRKVAMFGDSIILGRDGDGDSAARTANPIPRTVAKMLNVECTNYAVGGSGYIVKGSDNWNAYEKIASVNLAEYDTIALCFGVNDHFETLGAWNSTDETTVMGQFNKCINYIYEQNPNARVIVIAPFNGRNAGVFPHYWYGRDWGNIDTLLQTACEYYNLPYISQKNGPINAFTIQTLIGADGVHPNEEGYKRLGEWIAGEMRRLIG